MSKLKKTIVIEAPLKKVFDVVTDFKNFPKFQSEVEKVRVHKRTATGAEVTFSVNIIQKFSYTMLFNFKNKKHITWKLKDGGGVMKSNTGEWVLEELEPAVTELTFSMDIEFADWIPSFIPMGVVKCRLPEMLKNIKARAEK